MKQPKRKSTESLSPERLTLYVKPEHQELVQWVQEYTRARSLSEAVFLALAELKSLVREKRMQALDETHGIWRDDPAVADAFKEIEEGWKEWRRQIEAS